MSGAHAALAVVWLAVLTQRLAEIPVSARHERALARRGGRVVAGGGVGAIVVAHALWFAAWPIETVALGTRPPAVWPALAALVLAAEALRRWAIATLGERWTMRVVQVEGEPPVAAGPYRWLRHPNYLAVAVQIAALPLTFGAWRSALAGLALYLLGLARRLPVEERALRSSPTSPLDPSPTKP